VPRSSDGPPGPLTCPESGARAVFVPHSGPVDGVSPASSLSEWILQFQSITRRESTYDQPRFGQPLPEPSHRISIGIFQAGRLARFSRPGKSSAAGQPPLAARNSNSV